MLLVLWISLLSLLLCMFLTPVAVVQPSFHCADLLIGRRAFSEMLAILMCKFTYPHLVHSKNLIRRPMHTYKLSAFSRENITVVYGIHTFYKTTKNLKTPFIRAGLPIALNVNRLHSTVW